MTANAMRSTASLAERFAFKPAEGVSSSLTSSATKRRRLSSSATVAADGTDSILETSSKHTIEVTAASSTTATGINGSDAQELKKRKVSSQDELPNEVARNFADSLSKETGTSPASVRELLQLECETLHPTWLEALQGELRKDYFLKLKKFLWSEGVHSTQHSSKTIFPAARDIYSWSRFTSLPDVRVVILGQDPYHNIGQAHGLAFSVKSNVKVPPSLKNIYKEIKTDYPDFTVPNHGYLEAWARQGVLLLNTCLTVRAHQANSHSKKGWEEFTDSVLRVIDAREGPGVVFMAWGQPAQKRMKGINADKHLILSSAHPSPLSARTGFHGNAHFKRANEWLKQKYGDASVVDWTKLEPEQPLVNQLPPQL